MYTYTARSFRLPIYSLSEAVLLMVEGTCDHISESSCGNLAKLISFSRNDFMARRLSARS
jgi:hypothetical protein